MAFLTRLKSCRIPILGFGNDKTFFGWWSSKLKLPSGIQGIKSSLNCFFPVHVRGCHTLLALQWAPADMDLLTGWQGCGQESMALPLTSRSSLQPPEGPFLIVLLHMAETSLLVSSNLLQWVTESLLLSLLLLLPQSSLVFTRKNGLDCQPAVLTGMKCGLFHFHTSQYIFTGEGFLSNVLGFLFSLSIISDTAPWMSENCWC